MFIFIIIKDPTNFRLAIVVRFINYTYLPVNKRICKIFFLSVYHKVNELFMTVESLYTVQRLKSPILNTNILKPY